MFTGRWIAALFVCLPCCVPAQIPTAPSRFHLVMPSGPGAILVDTNGGWQIDRVMLVAQGKRPVLQMNNPARRIVVSYMLEHDPPYYDTPESCRNDTLGGILAGPLAKASVTNKQNTTRQIANGQTLVIGSYLIAKSEGFPINDQNVFGFLTHDHTCATIHLSRANFRPEDEHLFDSSLDSFTFDPNYIPKPEDYALMAKLLPPGMASAYSGHTKGAADGNAPRKITEPSANQSLSFGLARHPGYLHLDAPNFAITELSAKPNGREFGIRARDSHISGAEVLGFLFLPEPAQPSAVACRDLMLKAEEKNQPNRRIVSTSQRKSDSGVDIALVDYEQGKSGDPFHYVRRAFVANGDLCADISISGADKIRIDSADPLRTLVFDPLRPPDFFTTFRYAQVLFDHHAFNASAPVYVDALTLVGSVNDSLKWRRVTTDQASMAYGMSGDLKRSREINRAAIAKDPTYPLYYYSLACADAEEGNATAAREHLQQAFDRRANTLPGEHLPNPATDDSILKLKSNPDFWRFVQALPHS